MLVAGCGGKPGLFPLGPRRGLGPSLRLVPGPLDFLELGRGRQPGGGGGGGGGGAGRHFGCPFKTHVWPGGQIILVRIAAGAAMHPHMGRAGRDLDDLSVLE